MYNTLYKRFLQFIAPSYCPSCCQFISQQTHVFCIQCDAQIKLVAVIDLKIAANFAVPVYAASAYSDPVKNLILAKGRSNRTASSQLAYLIWNKTILPFLKFDYLVPIPLHWTRFARRGYNQAEVIARQLSLFSGKPILNVLQRKKMTKFQSVLNSDERVANLRSAFQINPLFASMIAEKRIMLVDDLLTTGATLESASKLIFKEQPVAINAVVAARVV